MKRRILVITQEENIRTMIVNSPVLEELGIGFVAFSPMANGFLKLHAAVFRRGHKWQAAMGITEKSKALSINI